MTWYNKLNDKPLDCKTKSLDHFNSNSVNITPRHHYNRHNEYTTSKMSSFLFRVFHHLIYYYTKHQHSPRVSCQHPTRPCIKKCVELFFFYFSLSNMLQHIDRPVLIIPRPYKIIIQKPSTFQKPSTLQELKSKKAYNWPRVDISKSGASSCTISLGGWPHSCIFCMRSTILLKLLGSDS